MKITGTNSYVKFNMENGYVMKGELLTGKRYFD